MGRKNLKQEALKRMKYLNLLPEVIDYFDETDKLFMSERQNKIFQATLYYVEDAELLERVKNFEEKYDGLVYHVQLTHTVYGDMYSFLYVSKHEDEWDDDWDDIKNEQNYAYIVNGDIEEFGLIGLNSYMGGIARIW